ncbi:MAG: M50 family metallopeptidase [Peptoniphilaceae bacterium]|nr:M50 family metallopeptidase [Peptoniphilaceae bacterium]MDY6019072.1 M50 family metallopeptidase [Anaerococcus sp.]
MKSVIIAIFMFLFLILIHEFGHFIIAKKSGIKVNEFAVGMGPRIYSKKKGETTYSLNLLPIGGYCAMEGEEDDSNDPRSFNNSPAFARFLTILAGPLTNLIFAGLIFAFIIANVGTSTNKVGGFMENSTAYLAGIRENDRIIKIGNKDIKHFDQISLALNDFYKDKKNKNEEIPIRVRRKGKEINYKVKVKFENGKAFLGLFSKLEKKGFVKSLGLGFYEVWKNILGIFGVFGALFSGAIGFSALSGPVGVVKELGNQANQGIFNLLYFFAYISVNLGFFNLLPIPALDGSKILTSIYEMITKKPVNRKIEQKATVVGFVLLLGLIFVVTIKDIVNLIL